MKKLLVTLAAVIVTVSSAFAQGTVIFDNRPGSGDAPIVLASDGVTGAGSIAGMKAELDLVGGTAAAPTYTPVGTTTFRGTSGALAKFITSVETAVTGVPAGGTATLVVRAYNGGDYASSLTRGQSGQFTVSGLGGTPPTGGPALPSPDLSGLQGFQVTTVPEPATIALGVLGAAALMLRRRK